eukprot:TRINITY_DN62991_c0_g1_i1.p1 TRINITY_DN62991_c0_g1~~TRINITY_DN62991_c0_g1_i1.p1  ORF type:complete len:148 (+),score=27.45 TRINITY_DN62991_c0_g1_i1:2-445(+)
MPLAGSCAGCMAGCASGCAAPVAGSCGGCVAGCASGCAAGVGMIPGAVPTVHHQKTKLFVGNLPADITAEVLALVFRTYGTVTNTHIMAGKSKSGQSCAFVEYMTPLEAETAVLTLHEKYEIRPGDGSIIVKYADNKSSNVARVSPY